MTHKPHAMLASEARRDDTAAGHDDVDDRGNANWDWAEEADLRAGGAGGALERLRKLDDPRIRVSEDPGDLRSRVKLPPKGPERGYSPYNSGFVERRKEPRKTDLRALSEWIKLRRKVAKNAVR